MSSRFLAELVALREAVATHLRYVDGELVEGVREGRHTHEVAANIAEHQSRNLRWAVEKTGQLSERDGTAGPSCCIPDLPTDRTIFYPAEFGGEMTATPEVSEREGVGR
jgi:hypothetical protein